MPRTTTKTPRELCVAGLKAYINIARAWGLTESESSQLLAISEPTYRHWKSNPENANVEPNQMERLSLILGIYKSLHILLPHETAADSWIKRPNANPRFAWQTPLERMLQGEIEDLAAVRRHLACSDQC